MVIRTLIPSGFAGEMEIIIPDELLTHIENNPVTGQLYVTHIGYYPNAKDHYRERPNGAEQYIFIYCEDGKGWVEYNGEKRPVYRGGVDFTVKSNEVKINLETGNVKTTHGVSLDVKPETVSKFGGAYKIESLPEGLKIIQRGARPEHFEIVPEYEMPLETFQELLNQIGVSALY